MQRGFKEVSPDPGRAVPMAEPGHPTPSQAPQGEAKSLHCRQGTHLWGCHHHEQGLEVLVWGWLVTAGACSQGSQHHHHR